MKIKIDKTSPAPIYEQIKIQVRSYFVDNGVEEGTLLPDIRKLASSAGVSTWAVDKALRELIDEGICYRRPKKGTFFGGLKNLNEKKAICGICHASGLDTFEKDLTQAAIYRGIYGLAHKKQMDTLFLPAKPSENISFYSARTRIDFKGVVMLHWEQLDEVIDLAERFPRIKFVHLNYYLNDFVSTPSNVYGVFNDDYAGAYQAVNYLSGEGHKKIAAISVPLENENYRLRLSGYRDALKDNGMHYSRNFVYSLDRLPGEDLRETGKRIADELLGSGEDFSAVFCVNDLLAEGFAMQLGKNSRIEIFGYDNLVPRISLDNSFSTVKIHFQKIGEKAVEILSNDSNRDFPKVLKITPQLLIRNRF